MTAAPDVPLAFRLRAQPLSAEALYAQGAAAAQLIAQLATAPGERLRALRGALCGGDGLVLLGPESALPWADGAVYLGRDPRAPQLLLPTYLEPDVPIELLARRLERDLSPAPIAVVPSAMRLLAVGDARVLTREALLARRVGGAGQDGAP